MKNKAPSRTPGSGGGEDDEGPRSFGGATAALPGWYAAPMCQSANHADQSTGRFTVLYDTGGGARGLSTALDRACWL
jgi:hypothetical protein